MLQNFQEKSFNSCPVHVSRRLSVSSGYAANPDNRSNQVSVKSEMISAVFIPGHRASLWGALPACSDSYHKETAVWLFEACYAKKSAYHIHDKFSQFQNQTQKPAQPQRVMVLEQTENAPLPCHRQKSTNRFKRFRHTAPCVSAGQRCLSLPYR